VHLPLTRLLVMIPFTFLLGCAKKVASRQDVQSDLIQSISLASEAETFTSYIRQGHSTYYFASGHLHYLLNEVNRTTQELSKTNPSPDLRNALNIDGVQLKLLAAQIERINRNLQHADVLADSEQQIREVRMTLVQANSSL